MMSIRVKSYNRRVIKKNRKFNFFLSKKGRKKQRNLYVIKNYFILKKGIHYLFLFNHNLKWLFSVFKLYMYWFFKFDIFFIFSFFYLFLFKYLFIYGYKRKYLILSFKHFYLSMKINFNIFLKIFFLKNIKLQGLILLYLNNFFLYIIFLLDYFSD